MCNIINLARKVHSITLDYNDYWRQQRVSNWKNAASLKIDNKTEKPKTGNRNAFTTTKIFHIFDAELTININVVIGFRSIRRNFIHLEQILELREWKRVPTTTTSSILRAEQKIQTKQYGATEKNVLRVMQFPFRMRLFIYTLSISVRHGNHFRINEQPLCPHMNAFICDLGCVHFFHFLSKKVEILNSKMNFTAIVSLKWALIRYLIVKQEQSFTMTCAMNW